MRADYFKKPQPTVDKAAHKIVFKQPMPKPAPKPGYKKAKPPGPSTSVDG